MLRCGEIKMSSDAEDFQLVCDSCSQVFTNLLDFREHVQQYHYEYETLESENIEKDSKCNQNKKSDEDLPYDDPLDTLEETEQEFDYYDLEYSLDAKDVKDEPLLEEVSIKEKALEEMPPHFKNKENEKLLAFIEAIKSCPVLWQPKDANYSNSKARLTALESVANCMNTRFENCKMNATSVKCKFKKIFSLWLTMSSQGKLQTPWLQKSLQFLAEIKQAQSTTHSSTTKGIVKKVNNTQDESKEFNALPAEENLSKCRKKSKDKLIKMTRDSNGRLCVIGSCFVCRKTASLQRKTRKACSICCRPVCLPHSETIAKCDYCKNGHEYLSSKEDTHIQSKEDTDISKGDIAANESGNNEQTSKGYSGPSKHIGSCHICRSADAFQRRSRRACYNCKRPTCLQHCETAIKCEQCAW